MGTRFVELVTLNEKDMSSSEKGMTTNILRIL